MVLTVATWRQALPCTQDYSGERLFIAALLLCVAATLTARQGHSTHHLSRVQGDLVKFLDGLGMLSLGDEVLGAFNNLQP